MKKKKNKLIKLLKTGILFFGISLLLWNCEKEETILISKNNLEKQIPFKSVTFQKLFDKKEFKELVKQSKIKPFFESKSNYRSKNNSDNIKFTLVKENVKIIEKENYKSYTFLVENIEEANDNSFINLVIEIREENINAFLIEYKPSKEFLLSKNIPFSGELSIRTIDYDKAFLSKQQNPDCGWVENYTLRDCTEHGTSGIYNSKCNNYGKDAYAYSRISVCGYGGNMSFSEPTFFSNDSNAGGSSSPSINNTSTQTAPVFPCGDQIHGCTRTANKIASKLNLTENERLWLNEQDENFILDLETFLLENNSIEAENFVIEVINAKVSSNYENLFKLNIFTQDPYNVWKRLSEEEKSLIKSFPTEAYQIFKNRPIAEEETRKRYGRNGLNDKSDAFRHCFFNAKNAFKVGRFMAEKFSDAHESETPTRWVKEKEMDIHNNKIGLNFVFSHNRSISNSDLSSEVQKKINDGSLRYLKPINLNDPNFRFTHGITNSTTLTPTNK